MKVNYQEFNTTLNVEWLSHIKDQLKGTFHIILTFIAVIAIRFKDAGLRDIVIQSMIVAEGSIDTTFAGRRA